jgi:HemY protein
MRKLFATVLVALLLGVGVVAVIETDPGYVLVSYGNYTLETSLWIGLLVLVLLVLSILLLLRLAYRIISGQRSLSSWFGTRKVRNALRHSTRGVISFTEGNWATARRQLLRGAQNNEAPLANYLLAARSSARLEDSDKVQEYLRAAGDAEPRAAVAVEVALAEMKLQAGEHQQALEALDQATRNVSRHPHVLTLLSQAYQGLEDWDKLAELLPQLQKHKLPSTAEFQRLEQQVYQSRLQSSAPDQALLRALWQKVPKHLQRDASMIELYVGKLVAAGDHATADKMIQRSLKQGWSESLVRQYGFLQCDDTSRQLARAENWLSAHPENAELLLCLGRLAARDKLWGKARDYFESSYRVAPGAEVCAELGRLLIALGEPKVAAAYFREGLLQREDELPQLPMPDKDIPEKQELARS